MCGAMECGHSVLPAAVRAGEHVFSLLWSPALVVAERISADPPEHRGDDLRLAAARGGPPGFHPLCVSLRV
jgi:hypothetical protein